MKIYRLDFDVNNYKSIQICNKADADYYQMFDGTSILDKWEQLDVMYYEEDKDLKAGDAPGFHIPVLNKRALDILLPIIENEVEILPLRLYENKLYGINVLKILNAIDYDLSEYKTFRDGKRIMAFKKYVFKEESIKGYNIFKIIDQPRGDIFVSEEFKNLIDNNLLEGFMLELVYE